MRHIRLMDSGCTKMRTRHFKALFNMLSLPEDGVVGATKQKTGVRIRDKKIANEMLMRAKLDRKRAAFNKAMTLVASMVG